MRQLTVLTFSAVAVPLWSFSPESPPQRLVGPLVGTILAIRLLRISWPTGRYVAQFKSLSAFGSSFIGADWHQIDILNRSLSEVPVA